MNVKLPTVRRLFVDQYTPEDFEEERKRDAILYKHHEDVKAFLVARGWTFYTRLTTLSERQGNYCHGSFARHPELGELPESKLLAQSRELEGFPICPPLGEWVPPCSKEGLIRNEIVELKPMNLPTASVFYLDYVYKE